MHPSVSAKCIQYMQACIVWREYSAWQCLLCPDLSKQGILVMPNHAPPSCLHMCIPHTLLIR